MFVKAEGPSGPAKIRSDDPKHALGLAQYLRTIGYNAWVEDTNGNEIPEKALKMAPTAIRRAALRVNSLARDRLATPSP
jgi:hypothetical protein